MKKTVFTGSGVAIVTPFDKEGKLHIESFKKHMDFLIDGGSDALIVCGTTGEGSTLSTEEKLTLFAAAVEHSAGRVPIIASTGGNNTAAVCDLSKQAEKVGVDALLQITPYYNKTSQAGLAKHFFTIADSTALPVILYNVPTRTSLNITPQTYKKLSTHENIVATKEANSDISSVAKTAQLCGDALKIYSGNDDQIVPIMSLGGIGVKNVAPKIIKKKVKKVCEYALAGDFERASSLQLSLLPLMDTLFYDVNPIMVKLALNLMGFAVGEGRLPLVLPDDENMRILLKRLAEYGLV